MLSPLIDPRSVGSRAPLCKVCFDDNQPEPIYTSHWVKFPPNFFGERTVRCPILLKNKCSHCGGIGHLTKCCKAFKQEKRSNTNTGEVYKTPYSAPNLPPGVLFDQPTQFNNDAPLPIRWPEPCLTMINMNNRNKTIQKKTLTRQEIDDAGWSDEDPLISLVDSDEDL